LAALYFYGLPVSRPAASAAPDLSSPPLVLVRGGHLFAPRDLGRHDLLLGYGKILAIGAGLAARFAPLGDMVEVDADGKLVVPGFIDQHLHFLGGGDFEGPLGRVPELHLSAITRAGITTAVGVMGIEIGFKTLHGLLVKARELERAGLSTYIYTGAFAIPPPYLTSGVRADITLIDKVIGVKIAVSEDTYPNLSLAELARVAGEVRLAAGLSGKAAVIHAHVGRNPTGLRPIFDLLDAVALPIAQVVPTHVNRRRPDTLAQGLEFARLGGTIDFSANLSKRSGSLSGMDPDEAVQRAVAAGVPLAQITLSSDSNVSMPVLDADDRPVGLHNAAPGILHREFVHVVRTNGLALADALPLVTSNVARVLGLADRKGSLAAGLDADVVLLAPDLSIDTVIAGGRLMVQAGRVLARGPFEEPSLAGPHEA
jgi:beta-aspartyl-dipeptidase (metallo-type)